MKFNEWHLTDEPEPTYELLVSFFRGVDRKGPGSEASTLRALSLLKDLPSRPQVVEFGCGSGAATIPLAQVLDGHITAVDLVEPFLEQVESLDWRLVDEKWFASVDSLLAKVFGELSPHREKFALYGSTECSTFISRFAVFKAAKEDFDCGLNDLRALIGADVFSDELEQAEELLTANYKVPAAVVAGTVLETTVRSLCHKNGIQHDRHTKLNKMNDDLAKVGEYNKAKADQIRAWAKIRNDAAHGHPEEFTETDVKLMIAGVRDFVANQMT